jgi:MoxR-like ATPase
MPVAYNVTGLAGIGKTSVCKELANEHDMNFIRVNLSELSYEEITGYPYLAAKLCKGEECKWVMDKMISLYTAMGWNSLHETRMEYAVPKWIHGLDNRPTVLFLDDFTRANPSVMQAIMTIIDEQKHTSWALPKGSTVILSSNPDNSEFFVSSLDDAQKS